MDILEKLKNKFPNIFILDVVWLNEIIHEKKIGKTFKLQKESLKTEMNHDEVDGDNFNDKKDEWLDYVKQDVLYTAFI